MRKFLLVALLLVTGCALGAQSVLKFNQFVTTLPSATTPLAGTEPTVIVQNGISKQVAVSKVGNANITVGSTGVVGGVSGNCLTDNSGLLGNQSCTSVFPGNPTATAGINPVTGSAATFMRSDAAPAVQKGSNAQLGLLQADGSTINAVNGVISATAIFSTATNGSPVNILSFGADPTGATDSTTAIQAAIDSLSGTNNRTVFCPDGVYKTTRPIFLDLPGNLRGADGTHGQAWVANQGYALGETVNSVGIAYINLTGVNTATAPASDTTNWRVFAWSGATSYATNSIVSFNGVPWISLGGSNLNNSPVANGGFWRPWFVYLSNTSANYNFGFTFTGNPGLPEQTSCNINVAFDDAVFFWIGPGNGNKLSSVGLVGTNPNNYYRGQYPPTGYGVCIPSGAGGANRTVIQDVQAVNVYHGYGTGCNNGAGVALQGALAAENHFIGIIAQNCALAVQIGTPGATQSDVNNVDRAQIGCTQLTQTENGGGIAVTNSNTGQEFGAFNSFNISGTSPLTTTGSGASVSYFFTTTLSAPLSGESCGISGGCLACPASNPSTNGDCVYNSWTIVLPHYGPIPIFIEGWVSSTRVATFATFLPWSSGFFGFNIDGNSVSDISTETRAATKVYANEKGVLFQGEGIRLDHLHIEQGVCTNFYSSGSNFSSERANLFEHLRFNYEPAFHSNNNTSDFHYPIYICQASWPFIDTASAGGGNVDLRESTLDGTGPLVLDISAHGRCIFSGSNNGALFNAYERIQLSGSPAIYGPQTGACEFDTPTFYPPGLANTISRWQNLPYTGWHPASFVIQKVDTGYYNNWLSPPAIGGGGNYPPMDGFSIYSVQDQPQNNPATPVVAKLVQSKHANYSWGQNLSAANVTGFNISYKGQSCAIQADTNTLSLMFPGLGITLDNGSGPNTYVVGGVMPSTTIDGYVHPGYFTVAPNGGCLAGTKGTIYSPATITQAAYTINTLTIGGP